MSNVGIYAQDGGYRVSLTDGAGVAGGAIQGNVPSGTTDSGNGVKIAGVFNTTPPVGTTGQRRDVELDSQGNQRVQLVSIAATGADGVLNTALGGPLGLGAHTTLLRPIVTANWVFNGTSWDRQRKSNLSARVASSAASGNPAFLKNAAGELRMFWGQNGAAITYLQIYNKASAPTIGTDVPILTFPVAANAFFSMPPLNDGLYFATGIAYAFTTDAAATTGAAAAAVTSFNIIGA